MKNHILLVLLIASTITFSQSTTDIQGKWISLDGDFSTPFIFDFKEDGLLSLYQIDESPSKVYKIIQGSYYTETNSNLLVTITWFGEQAMTSKYEYEFANRKLTMEQTYPQNKKFAFMKEEDMNEHKILIKKVE